MNSYEYILKKYSINADARDVIEIPNMGRDDLAKLFAELEFNVGAEIGVARGTYSEVLCKANPKLHLFSIDPWEFSAYGSDAVPSEINIHDKQEGFDAEYEKARETLAPYNCTIIRKDSITAASDFADGSLDFVYIDANHDFVNATNDIGSWKKKVRNGGIVSGHDYKHFAARKHNHVRYVVEAYTRAYEIVPLFVVGTKSKGPNRDVIRSWFWVKS